MHPLFQSLQALRRPDDIGYNRLAYSAAEDEAMQWAIAQVAALPVRIYEDSVRNVIMTYEGATNRRIAFGSHLDTVKHGGLFDGALGVIAGIACFQQWAAAGYVPTKQIDLCIFRAEEANPLGGTFGSRAFAGLLTALDAPLLAATANLTPQHVLAAKTAHAYDAFIELHIEQGRVLEEEALDLGIVTSISGILRTRYTFVGEARHAGTTPMAERQDALVAASRFVLFCQQAPQHFAHIVCTVGELVVQPNQASIIPSEVVATLEIRGHDLAEMERFAAYINDWLATQPFTAHAEQIVQKPPGKMDSALNDQVHAVIRSLGYTSRFMMCGASHDCNSMATLCPSTMIFIPSVNGISHHPDEWSTAAQVDKGIHALKATMEMLAT